MFSHRRGFTLIEMLVVLAIVSVLAGIAVTKSGHGSNAQSIRSGKQEIAALLATARATAIQNGRVASFVRSGNTIRVVMDNGGGPTVIGPIRDLHQSYGVDLGATRDTVPFDPRGLMTATGGTIRLTLSKNGTRDSVCVLTLGKVLTQSCSL